MLNTRDYQNISNEEIMTTEQVANLLKVSVSVVRRWTRENRLKGYKLGGKGDWRYLKGEVIRFLIGPQG